MQITDVLGQMGGLQSMARELGVSEAKATAGADALLPAILGGFKKQAQAQPAGLDGLGGLLGQLGGGGLLDNVLSPQPTDVGQGNDVLGQIFGSKDVSRTVTQSAAARTGLDPALLRRMLPMLAMLVAGFMAKQQGAAAVTEGPATTAGGGLAAPARRRRPAGWPRCSTSTATATRSTTSCAWPARPCAEAPSRHCPAGPLRDLIRRGNSMPTCSRYRR